MRPEQARLSNFLQANTVLILGTTRHWQQPAQCIRPLNRRNHGRPNIGTGLYPASSPFRVVSKNSPHLPQPGLVTAGKIHRHVDSQHNLEDADLPWLGSLFDGQCPILEEENDSDGVSSRMKNLRSPLPTSFKLESARLYGFTVSCTPTLLLASSRGNSSPLCWGSRPNAQ